MSLSSQERKSLEDIHRLFLKLEKTSQDGAFNSSLLILLRQKIEDLKDNPLLEISRLAEVSRHLSPDMTLRHFAGFAIPFERLLHRSLQDDDFLIVEQDKTEKQVGERVPLPLVFVLDNLRSAFNVGSIFRTAECLGAEKIFLCGYTPHPTQFKVEKTAMGTEEYMAWADGGRLNECLRQLKDQAYHLVALETSAKAQDLYTDFSPKPTAFILGNERFGLDPEILKLIDEVRIVPLRGRKNSLNVGVTAAVAGFEWMRQWRARV